MESNKKPMKKSLVVTIIFVIVVLLLTFFSKTLYNMNIPSVKVVNPTYGALMREISCDAVVVAEEEYSLYANGNQQIIQVLVEEGDLFRKGDVLIRLDTSYLEDEMLQLELELQQVKDSKRYMSKTAYPLALEIAEKKIEKKQAQIDASTMVASETGYVISLNAQVGMTTNAIEPLLTFRKAHDDLQVVFNVTMEQASWFACDDKVNIKIPMLNKALEGRVSEIRADQNGEINVILSLVDPPKDVLTGQLAEVSFVKMTDYFPTLVPISAVRSEGGRDYIFRVETVDGGFGDELRLYKMYVTVTDEDETYAAIDAELSMMDEIVTESDMELAGGRVKMMDD